MNEFIEIVRMVERSELLHAELTPAISGHNMIIHSVKH